jgi:hypothetical protein
VVPNVSARALECYGVSETWDTSSLFIATWSWLKQLGSIQLYFLCLRSRDNELFVDKTATHVVKGVVLTIRARECVPVLKCAGCRTLDAA